MRWQTTSSCEQLFIQSTKTERYDDEKQLFQGID